MATKVTRRDFLKLAAIIWASSAIPRFSLAIDMWKGREPEKILTETEPLPPDVEFLGWKSSWYFDITRWKWDEEKGWTPRMRPATDRELREEFLKERQS